MRKVWFFIIFFASILLRFFISIFDNFCSIFCPCLVIFAQFCPFSQKDQTSFFTFFNKFCNKSGLGTVFNFCLEIRYLHSVHASKQADIQDYFSIRGNFDKKFCLFFLNFSKFLKPKSTNISNIRFNIFMRP